MSIAISVKNLSKEFKLGALGQEDMIRSTIMNMFRPSTWTKRKTGETLWALKDVSFEVEEGEVVGIIGRNGAGKSTLLKLLSGITYASEGSISVQGRIASLLEVGTGFHEELTGRENVYLNGSILGMKKKEIDRKMNDIVAFSGVERFMDTPIKRYSSGMRLRLGFAVAAHLDPDVMLVDEVLAVGDAGFQRKCIEAMRNLRSGGRTVLFVSHNMAAIENFCPRVIWIDNSRVREDGPCTQVITNYLATFGAAEGNVVSLEETTDRRGNGVVRFTEMAYLDENGKTKEVVRSGDRLTVRFHYRAKERVVNPRFGFEIRTDFGTLVTLVSTWDTGQEIPFVEGEGHIDLAIEFLNLQPARYYLKMWVKGGMDILYDVVDNFAVLNVESSNYYGSGRGLHSSSGVIFLPCTWKAESIVRGIDAEETDAVSRFRQATRHA